MPYNNMTIEEAKIGDIFAAQNKDTRNIDGRYLKVNYKKRSFKDIEGGGFVSAYDIKSFHSNCKFVFYANTKNI